MGLVVLSWWHLRASSLRVICCCMRPFCADLRSWYRRRSLMASGSSSTVEISFIS